MIFIFFTEPSGCQLIEEFLSVDAKNQNSKLSDRIVDVDGPSSPAPSTPTVLQFTRKQLALKILALKVAPTLNWNLGIFFSRIVYVNSSLPTA